MTELAFELRDDRGVHLIEVHDDTRTCYAYLYRGDEIVADVWIYNVAQAPEDWPWARPGVGADDAPFENPQDLVHGALERPVIDPDGANLSSEWQWRDSELEYASVLIDGVEWARLAPGSRPGWARLARQDGPVAKAFGSG